MNISAQEKKNAGVWFSLLSAVLAASVCLPLPSATGQIGHLPSICPFYNLTGLPCPGCGLTRAFVCLGHGRFWEALHWHPLGWLVYAVFVVLWLRTGLFWMRRITILPLSPRATAQLGFAALFVIVGVGLIRMDWFVTHHLRF